MRDSLDCTGYVLGESAVFRELCGINLRSRLQVWVPTDANWSTHSPTNPGWLCPKQTFLIVRKAGVTRMPGIGDFFNFCLDAVDPDVEIDVSVIP